MGNECLLDDQLGYDCLVFISTGHLVQQQQNMSSAGCYRHCLGLQKHACVLATLCVHPGIVYVVVAVVLSSESRFMQAFQVLELTATI